MLRTLVFVEKPVATRDGRWYLVRIMPYRMLDNRIDGLVITFIDITVSKTLEAKQQQASEKLMNILNSISDAFLSLDDNLVITYFNPAAEQLLKRGRAEIVGRYLFDAFPEDKGSIFDDKCQQAVKEKVALSFQTYFESAPYQGWYDVRVYPQADGISVFFQMSAKPPTSPGSDKTPEVTP